MSTINAQLFEGHTFEQKGAFVKALTEADCVTLDCGAESVDIIFQDAECEDWASAGKLRVG